MLSHSFVSFVIIRTSAKQSLGSYKEIDAIAFLGQQWTFSLCNY